MLDTIRSVTTPELIEIQLHPAGILSRALAWLVDIAIRLAVLILLSLPLRGMDEFGLGILLLAFFLLEWFYPVLFEVLASGASPGKRLLGLVVISANGTPVGWGPALTRNLLRAADFLPFFYTFGILSILLDKEFRRLGDIVAGTLVVHREAQRKLPTIVTAEALAPQTPLSRASQRALVAFAERAMSLTPARQEELAELVPHLAHAPSGPQGAARLVGLANHLIGRRA